MKPETINTATALLSAGIADKHERAELLAFLRKQVECRDKLMTTAVAAKFADVHPKTLFAWERKGYLHPRRITPSRGRWSRLELEAFLCESATEGIR